MQQPFIPCSVQISLPSFLLVVPRGRTKKNTQENSVEIDLCHEEAREQEAVLQVQRAFCLTACLARSIKSLSDYVWSKKSNSSFCSSSILYESFQTFRVILYIIKRRKQVYRAFRGSFKYFFIWVQFPIPQACSCIRRALRLSIESVDSFKEWLAFFWSFRCGNAPRFRRSFFKPEKPYQVVQLCFLKVSFVNVKTHQKFQKKYYWGRKGGKALDLLSTKYYSLYKVFLCLAFPDMGYFQMLSGQWGTPGLHIKHLYCTVLILYYSLR